MEVLHGDIRITLSDQDAIRGMDRTRRAVKRGMALIEKEKALVKIEGDLKDLDKKLIQSRRILRKWEGEKATATLDADVNKANAEIKKAQKRIKMLDGQRAEVEISWKGEKEHLENTKRQLALDAKAEALQERENALQEQYNRLVQKEGQLRTRAHREMEKYFRDDALMRRRAHAEMEKYFRDEGLMRLRAERMMEKSFRDEGVMRTRAQRAMEQDFARREREERASARLQQQALDMDVARQKEVAKLQQAYHNLNVEQQKMRLKGRVGRAVSPKLQAEFDIRESEVLGEMAVLRAKLEAMNVDPIDIKVDVRTGDILEKIARIGDVGMRLGPFTGTLKSFTVAALALGPILTGLVGSTTALAGAIGTGLTGALGLGAAGLTGFGLAAGVAFAGIKPAFDDLAGIIKRSKDYNNKVEQHGKTSDEAGKALEKFKHILGDVDDQTLQSFLSLQSVGKRWRDMTSSIRPDFFKTVGVGIESLNTMLPMLARNSKDISGSLFEGLRGWARGLSSAKGQGVLSRILGRTQDSIEPMMKGLGSLGAAFGKLTASFARHFKPIMSDFRDWAEGLNEAADNTERLDNKVDGLMGSLGSTLGFFKSMGGLLAQIASIASGPGGGMMDDMAAGMDRMTQSLKDNPEGLRDFFEGSVETMENLYGLLKPLMGLFMEFSTILRPLTNIALQFAGGIAEIVEAFAGFGPIRGLAQVYLSLWFLKRGNLAIIGLFAGALNGLATALSRVAAAAASRGFAGLAGALGRGRTAATGAAGRLTGAGGAAVAPVAGRAAPAGSGYVMQRGLLVPAGAAGAARVAAPVAGAAQAGRIGGMMSTLGRGFGALSTGLLGVSGPVAALGIAAVGAGVGLNKLLKDSEAARARAKAVAEVYGKPKAPDVTTGAYRPPGDQAMTPGASADEEARLQRINEEWREQTQQVEQAYAKRVIMNQKLAESVQIQGELAQIFSDRQSAALNVESAEEAYAAAVKLSGENSLQARMAHKQMVDARREEVASIKVWRDTYRNGAGKVREALAAAGEAYGLAMGTYAEDEAFADFEKAKDNVVAFELSMRRAKRGLDAFTGEGATKLGHFVRQFEGIKGFKRLIVRAETQEAAMKIAKVVDKLDAAGKKKVIARILANTKDPEEALEKLRAAFKRYEDKPNVAELKADARDVKNKLGVMNLALMAYGKQKPEALLRARDEAKAKLERLLKQLENLDGKVATTRVKVDFNTAFNSSPGSDAAQGDGWGTATPNLSGEIEGWAQGNKKKLTKELFFGGLGGAMANGSGLNAFNGLAQRFGLTVGSGFRKGSITSSGNLSYHAMGRARDFPGPPAAMMKFAQFMAASFGSRLKELIYTPLGFSIKNGRKVAPYAQKDHYDHVHVAMATGGRVGPEKTRSGRYTQPTVLFAEEPRRPEYFISTNPRDKKRSRRLITEAAAEVGMLEHSPMFEAQTFAGGGGRGLQSRIMRRVLKRAPALSKWNRIFKTVFLGGTKGAPRMTAKEIRGLAEAMGMNPTLALHMSQIAKGESSRFPGMQQRDPGDGMVGYGLLQMTPNAWGAKAKNYMNKLGGINAMKNPILNMAMAKFLADDAKSTSGNPLKPWYGTKFLNRNAKGKSVLGDFGAGKGKGGNAAFGATTNLENKIAEAQAEYDIAKTTTPLSDDINVLSNRPAQTRELTAKEKRSKRRRIRAINRKLRGRMTEDGTRIRPSKEDRKALRKRRKEIRESLKRGTKVEVPRQEGLIRLTRRQRKAARDRIEKINERLKGKLTPAKRKELLAEKAQLMGTVASTTSTIKDLRTEKAEAQFQDSQIALGRGTDQNAWRTAQAETTATLDDDISAAKEEAEYWKARETWALERNDLAGAAEARTNWNNATKTVEDLQAQTKENILSYASAQAQGTATLTDDLAAAQAEAAYWKERAAYLLSIGDIAGAATATTNYNNSTETVSNLKDDIKRLPLERDLALAGLTEDVKDDQAATKALRDYWQTKLNEATAAGDIAGQIEAATNLKNYNEQIKAAEQTLVQQSMALSDARLNLFTQMGSNFVQTIPTGALYPQTQVANNAPAGTTVNITNNFDSGPPDPLTYAANTGWEIQAAV